LTGFAGYFSCAEAPAVHNARHSKARMNPDRFTTSSLATKYGLPALCGRAPRL